MSERTVWVTQRIVTEGQSASDPATKFPLASPQQGIVGVLVVFASREQAEAFNGGPGGLFEVTLRSEEAPDAGDPSA